MLKLSALDEDLLRIETPVRPMHWCIMAKLRSDAASRVDLAALRHRVAERAASRDVFSIAVTRNRFRAPGVRMDTGDIDPEVMIRHQKVRGQAQMRLLLASMMAHFNPTDRLWEITLVDDTSSAGQYLITRVHHCLADGLSAAGFAYLFVDGTKDQLAHFDRYLISPRFSLDPIDRTAMIGAWRHLAHTWSEGRRGRRPAQHRPSATRLVNHLALPAAAVNSAARSYQATQSEFLLASVTHALRSLPLGEGITTMRTMIPITLDPALRHTGNAMAFALVNLPMTETPFENTLAEIRRQIGDIARQKPHFALPTLTQQAGGPWLYKRFASRAIMNAVRPNIDVGLTPIHVSIDRVFGVEVEAVLPFSPLVYTPISIAALLLGRKLTLGITTEAGAVGGLGEALADELSAQLTHAEPAVAM